METPPVAASPARGFSLPSPQASPVRNRAINRSDANSVSSSRSPSPHRSVLQNSVTIVDPADFEVKLVDNTAPVGDGSLSSAELKADTSRAAVAAEPRLTHAEKVAQIDPGLSAALYGHDLDDANVNPSPDAVLHYSPFNRRRKYIFPVKQAVLAVVLLIVGIVMTVVGVTQGSFPVLLVGALSFIPGGYQSYVLVQTYKRKPGYRVEDTYEAVDV